MGDAKKDHKNFGIDWFLNNWKCVWLVIPISFKDRKHDWRSSPPVGILKNNVDGVDRDKPGHPQSSYSAIVFFFHWS